MTPRSLRRHLHINEEEEHTLDDDEPLVSPQQLANHFARQTIQNLVLAAGTGNVDVARLTQRLPPNLAGEVTALAMAGEDPSDAECARMITDCLAHLRRKYLKGMEREVRIAIRAAEEQNDEKAKRERILEWQDLVRKERQLERRKLEPKRPAR